MKKKIISTLLAATVFTSLIPCALAENVAEGKCGENAVWAFENGTLTIGGNGDMEEYGYGYERMAPWWDYRYSISKIVVENGITHIGSRTFAMCKNLEKVNIADSVTSIGEYAFENAQSLQSITIPDSVTQMGTRVFGDCENLKTVNMPSKITEIKDEMFFRCYALNKINIPNGVTKIGANAFDECEALQSISLPNGLTSIGEWAFYGCGLKSISIPDTVTTIGASAFRVCTSLKCVKLPTGIDRIDEYMFYGDTSLMKIAIPNGVEDIRVCAFADCDRIGTVKIPLSVKCIYDTAFGGNTVVYDVYYSGTEEEWNKIEVEGPNYTGLTDLHFLSYTPSEEVFTQYDYADKVDIQQQIKDDKIILTITPMKTSTDLSQIKMYVPEYTSEGVFVGLKDVEQSEPDENGAVAMSAELPNNGKVFLWDKDLTPVIETVNASVNVGTISGTVKSGGVISGAKLGLYNSNNKLVARAESDENGSFTFENVPVGEGYFITTSYSDYPLRRVKDIVVTAGENTAVQVVLIKGDRVA